MTDVDVRFGASLKYDLDSGAMPPTQLATCGASVDCTVRGRARTATKRPMAMATSRASLSAGRTLNLGICRVRAGVYGGTRFMGAVLVMKTMMRMSTGGWDS